MHRIIEDFLTDRETINSIYLIGSSETNYHQEDSDTDLVLILNKRIKKTFVEQMQEKYPFLDLALLEVDKITTEIANPPSYYLSVINQIQLNPRKLFGSNFIEQVELCNENVLFNQLHFPYFLILRLVNQNGRKIKQIEQVNSCFEEILLGQEFTHEGKTYYSYRNLNTLILTLCSFKLIANGKFRFSSFGKHWFIIDYLKKCKDDINYDFCHQYFLFKEKFKTNIFDRPSTFLESKIFKSQLLNFIEEYRLYLKSPQFHSPKKSKNE